MQIWIRDKTNCWGAALIQSNYPPFAICSYKVIKSSGGKKKKKQSQSQTNLGFGLASSECVLYAEIDTYSTVHERISKTFFSKNYKWCLMPCRAADMHSCQKLWSTFSINAVTGDFLPLLYSEWKQMQPLFFWWNQKTNIFMSRFQCTLKIPQLSKLNRSHLQWSAPHCPDVISACKAPV